MCVCELCTFDEDDDLDQHGTREHLLLVQGVRGQDCYRTVVAL